MALSSINIIHYLNKTTIFYVEEDDLHDWYRYEH